MNDDLYTAAAVIAFALLGILTIIGTILDIWLHHSIFSEPTHNARSFTARSIRSGSIVSTNSTATLSSGVENQQGNNNVSQHFIGI